MAEVEWLTGTNYAYIAEHYPYTHLIRGPDDPEETVERGKDTTGWKRLDTKDEDVINDMADSIVMLLSDDVPRTFNRISVELFGRTADVVSGKDPDKALWLAVERKEIKFTMEAPILFVRYRPKKKGKT